MTARDTMASALRSTGLYTLNGKTLVDQELLAYCAALDTLYERLEVCKQDSFIGTASETGLLRWEALFGLKAHGSLEERREVLLQCGAVQNTSNTRSAFLELFQSIGVVEKVPETLIDAVCGLSGGGPAYVAMFIESMADAGVKQGLPRATAYRLAAQTCLGTAKMILTMDIHPGQLKDMVTSPGGTTIEGCEALEKGGMRGAVIECVNAATEKSRQL